MCEQNWNPVPRWFMIVIVPRTLQWPCHISSANDEKSCVFTEKDLWFRGHLIHEEFILHFQGMNGFRDQYFSFAFSLFSLHQPHPPGRGRRLKNGGGSSLHIKLFRELAFAYVTLRYPRLRLRQARTPL